MSTWTCVNIIEVLKKYRTQPKILSFVKVHLSGEGDFILCYCPFNIPSSACQAVLVSVFPFVIFPLESHFHSFKEHLSAIILPNCKSCGVEGTQISRRCGESKNNSQHRRLIQALKVRQNHKGRKTLQITDASRNGEQQRASAAVHLPERHEGWGEKCSLVFEQRKLMCYFMEYRLRCGFNGAGFRSLYHLVPDGHLNIRRSCPAFG